MNIKHICVVFHVSEINRDVAYNKETFIEQVFSNIQRCF